MSILLSVIFGIASAVLYRMGGSGNYKREIRLYGLPTLMIIYYTITGNFHWSLIICFGLLFGSLTTYWKKKGTDAKWYNWLFTGLGYSLAMLPYCIATHHFLGFLERTIVVTIFTTVWSQLIGYDIWEEFGRGFIICVTLFLLT